MVFCESKVPLNLITIYFIVSYTTGPGKCVNVFVSCAVTVMYDLCLTFTVTFDSSTDPSDHVVVSLIVYTYVCVCLCVYVFFF